MPDRLSGAKRVVKCDHSLTFAQLCLTESNAGTDALEICRDTCRDLAVCEPVIDAC
jgi:hypothetical protein